MGRPPLHPEEGARIGHSLRLRPSIDQAVREAAEKNNRSLAEEMEHRINKSFDDEDSIEELIELRVKQRTDVMLLKLELEECSFKWRQALDTKYLSRIYKSDLVHKGGLIRRIQMAIGNRFIRMVNIEGDKTSISISDLEDREAASQARIEYYKERYAQLSAELVAKLSTDKDARKYIDEDDIITIMQSNARLNRKRDET